MYPNNRIIYNKLWLSNIQNLKCNPIPIIPSEYPVIIKPIINLEGMSKGFKKINSKKEYTDNCNLPGYFYQKYLDGNQYNFDIIINNGEIVDYFCLESKPLKEGMFLYHKYISNKLPQKVKMFIETIFDNYTGFLNLEIIDEYVIEGHLRLNGDLFIYTENDIEKLIEFSESKIYKKLDTKKNIGFFPLFLEDLNINFKLCECLLNEDFILEYKFDDVNSNCQNNKNRRFLYFTSYNFEKSIELQQKIYYFLFEK